MKNILKLLFAGAALITLYSSCDKVNDLPLYKTGNPVVLSSSVIAAVPAPSDSNNVAVTFSWTSPNYAQSPSLYKFIVQIDSTGKNFSNPYSTTFVGTPNGSMLAKELNAAALSLGFAFNTIYVMNIRVIASYGNNNDQYISNTIRFTYTPYKVPPKVALPTTSRLFLVGDASQGGWNNPVPVPSQEFARLDETTWAGVFNLNGGKQYLVLPANGDWSNKFSIADGTLPAAGGNFGFNYPTNFNGPATSGWYIITLNFQTGKYSVVPYTGNLPTNLFIVGDATPGGWNNPVPVPSQQFTRLNSSIFKLSLPLNGGKQYLFLPVNGDWSNKYAVADNSLPGLAAGGKFGYNLGQNFPGPANSGNYTVTANFVTQTFTVQ